MGNFTISEELKRAFKERNIECFEIREASPEEFYDAIGRAKISNEHGAFVTQHSVEDYSQMQHLFLTTDGSAGVAITSDGNIVSIFNGGEKRGVLKTLLPLAIEHGGRKLDNYDSEKLSAMYELHGVLPMRIATLPLAYLHDPVVFLRRPYHDVTFLDTISQRFLTIHILPGLASGYHLQAVPMIGSTYDYEIDILIVYQFTPVFI